MRGFFLVLFDTTVAEADVCLERVGFERLTGIDQRWNYPSGVETTLYGRCREYDVDIVVPEEHVDILRCSKGRRPTVVIDVDVSNWIPGVAEARYVAQEILSRFDGLAFDDWTSLEHGFTFDEIRNWTQFRGLHFFDHLGKRHPELD